MVFVDGTTHTRIVTYTAGARSDMSMSSTSRITQSITWGRSRLLQFNLYTPKVHSYLLWKDSILDAARLNEE